LFRPKFQPTGNGNTVQVAAFAPVENVIAYTSGLCRNNIGSIVPCAQ
jgi:hypothetical protein